MNTNNRELLELAAKAAGVPVEYRGFGSGEAVLSRLVYDNKNNGITAYKPWNPLEDDGDAFRLAVNLMMSVEICEYESSTYAYVGAPDRRWAMELWKEDKGAATRRAIVRAAAEIGKNAQ